MSHIKDLEQTKHLLAARRKHLSERHTRVQRDLMRTNDPLVADSADRAIQLENDSALEAIDAAAVNEIAAIDAALRRIDQGLYGVCSQCSHAIESSRLASVPYATACAGCAS